jgi:hypothetical protein
MPEAARPAQKHKVREACLANPIGNRLNLWQRLGANAYGLPLKEREHRRGFRHGQAVK